MAYEYSRKADNVHLLDTRMFGFERFQSCYLVAGRELALIDAGVSTSFEVVRAAIEDSGFAIKDIAHIFVTHAEHPDHSGNVGAILKENATAKVYVAPAGLEYLTHPGIESAKRKANLSAQMAARFGEMVPVPRSRIQLLKEGDSFDLGDGEKLKIMMTPGHQPSGIVILQEKSQGLFINDLCGASFPDAGAAFVFTPLRADIPQTMASLKRVMDLPVKKLYLGHFGICNEPREVLETALAKAQQLLELASACRRGCDPEEIMQKALAITLPEAGKLRAARGERLYEYVSQELMPSMARAFAGYCSGLYGKQF